ncbi:tail fiber protein [Aquimarina aggregata]|uniref:tail fiber protein n=1 Tax=Aquimarina aggregata TaxID=1642818 RepID=UPI00249105E2|nr:tail fiber protein [Aquimarina aggregata]
MKRILFLSVSFIFISSIGIAQNNIFPLPSGNVGLGTTSPSYKLHIKDPAGGAALRVERGGKSWDFSIQNTGEHLYLNNSENTSTFFTFNKDGKFGIGTTNPLNQLHIKDLNSPSVLNVTGKSPNTGNDELISEIRLSNLYDNLSGHRASIKALSDKSGSHGNVAFQFDTSIWNGQHTEINAMRISSNGNVGIGTTSPNEKLHIEGNILVNAYQTGGAKGIFFRENFTSNDKKYNLSILTHHDGDNTPDALDINAYDGVYFNTGSNDRNPRMTIQGNGNVGIGTTTPDSKLAVNGKIHAKEVKVDLTGWPDYVFEENYKLPTLKEVESHIQEKGHLPNIPSAKKVEKEGIQLGEMNAKLLQKIEELTLYIIAQNKKTEQLQKEVALLKQKIK